MSNTTNLDQLKSDAETKSQAAVDAQVQAQEALQAASEADAAHRTARTDSFNEQLVATARDYGINPDNFETEEGLQGAVDSFPQDEKPKPAEPAPGLNPELIAQAKELGIDSTQFSENDPLENAIFKASNKHTEGNPDIAPAE